MMPARRRVLFPIAAVIAAGLAAGLATGSGVGAQVGDRSAIDSSSPPAHWNIPPAPVRSPEESIRQMELPPGFRIEVVASEPVVQDPIAFAFDDRGRLWVLEWPSYNWQLREILPDLAPLPPPLSRVVLVEDTTGDGRMDTRTVFAEMEWPRGILPMGDGVIVFALPDVVFLRDTTGDGRADERRVIDTGLPIPANPHSAPSSPVWTIDNWIYGLHTTDRLRAVRGQWRQEPTGRLPGQWGASQDDHGRLFFSYNGDHLRGSLVPPHYAARNPHFPATAGTDERIAADQTTWPHDVTPGVNRRAQLRDDGRLRVFTANAAPSIYRGDHFPEEFRGNAFLGESAGRLIRRSILSEHDGVVTARNAYEDREFLFSRDERFRPVFTSAGPDGALYVADMYRGIIEGHIFVTTFLRNQIVERNLHQPFHGMGRIYRIVHEGRPVGTPPIVQGGSAAGWLPHLAHGNGFWRDVAQRSIVAAGDPSVVPALRELAATAPDARTRVHAAWTMEGLDAVDADVVTGLLRDASPRVRSVGLRLAEPLMEQASVLQAGLRLIDETDAAVRRQLVHTLGASRAPEAERAVLTLLRRHGGEPFLADAAVSGMAGRERLVLDQILSDPAWAMERPGSPDLVTALASAIAAQGPADRLVELAGDASGQPVWRRLAILQGIDAAAGRGRLQISPGAVALLRDEAHPEVRDRARDVGDRIARAAAEPALPVVGQATASPEMVEQGRQQYAICAACHQADGRGLPSLAPPLQESATVTGPSEALIEIVLNGRDQDPAYPTMPPLAGMPDDQLAAILTYVRQAWGNAATPVSADQVREGRGASGPQR